jgi:shikimate kinase
MNSPAQSVVLIGMMGAGKSSVGRRLQERTGLPLVDTDEAIVVRAGLAIREIFALHGERRFRELEGQILEELASARPAIFVTGGGLVVRKDNIALLKTLGTVFWLDGQEETLFERATRHPARPLLQTENPRATFSEILRGRVPLYAEAADVRVDTTGATHHEVVDLILQEIETRTAARH